MIFFIGFLIGLFIAVPVGPISLICVQRTLTKGVKSGFLSGMGSTTADILYAGIAFLGLSAFAKLTLPYMHIFHVFSSVILIVWGIFIFKSHVHTKTTATPTVTYIGDFFSTFFLTISNPLTILFFPAFFSHFSLATKHTLETTVLFLIGILLGSTLWWILLCNATKKLETKIHTYIPLINKIVGLLVALLGGIFLMKSSMLFLH